MPEGYKETSAGRWKVLIGNPHIADSHFGNSVEAFTSTVFAGVLYADSKWYRTSTRGGEAHTLTGASS